jgi:hypothetical protein
MMDLDEGLRIPGLEVQNQETVIKDGVAAQGVALFGNPDDHSYPDNLNVGST